MVQCEVVFSSRAAVCPQAGRVRTAERRLGPNRAADRTISAVLVVAAAVAAGTAETIVVAVDRQVVVDAVQRAD